MSDFHFRVSVLRDEVASALTDDAEQAAYVLGEYAELTTSTMDRDDLLDMLDSLSGSQKASLLIMCRQICGRLSDEVAA